MKHTRNLSLVLIVCLIVTLLAPALGQEAAGGPIGGRAFAALLQEAFPAYAADTFTTDEPVTGERALSALCAAVGLGTATPAENLAFAIENDLLPGVAYTPESTLTEADARAMIAAFAGYVVEQLEQERAEMMQTSLVSYNKTTASGAVPMSMEDGGVYLVTNVQTVNYNQMNDESYGASEENRFQNPMDSPFSTFALDVDTASYANIRRFLLGGNTPDVGAVRIEEMLNYFDYALPAATKDRPVAVATEVNVCPWNPDHLLAMVALSSYAAQKDQLPGSNLVFLVDVSGSMEQDNRLPLARKALKLLLTRLDERDTVAIVTYAGSVGTLLAPTSAEHKAVIEAAIDGMNAGGSTNGAGGIEAAYALAEEAFISGGNNRVILLTDGDFNVGVQSAAELQALIEGKRSTGIYLSVLGFGMGNLKDYEMETLADMGNGNYAYIDTLKEAKKVFVDDMTGTIFTVAKDVKLQVEFNPAQVAGYRLIGYENRLLSTEDFNDDQKDAGEMGAGRQMIALYELIPAAGEAAQPTAVSRYQDTTLNHSDEAFYVAVRYQLPETLEVVETGSAAVLPAAFGPMSETMAFASAVAEFGLLLKDSSYKGDASLQSLLERAMQNRGEDPFGTRAEFTQIVSLTMLLTQK